jgi:hypothetical protein
MKARLLLKVLLWIVGASCAIVVTCYLIVRFVNRHDQPVSASVVRFEELSRQLPAVADKDNGYVYFMGFDADQGADPAEVGMQRIAWSKQRLAHPDSPQAPDFPAKKHDLRGARSAAFDKLLEECKEVDRACLRALGSSVQDTSNQHAARLWAAADELAVSYEQLPVAAAAVQRHMNAEQDASMFANGLYNVIGNVLLRAGSMDIPKYAIRIADIEGVRRAALLTAQFRGRNIPAEKIEAELAAPSIGSPYDGKPFVWDAVAQSIVFIGLGEGKFSRTSFLY